MEKGSSYPDQSVLTNAKEHDRSQLEVLMDDKECMYAFDRGYLDYKRFDEMTDNGFSSSRVYEKMRSYGHVSTLNCQRTRPFNQMK